MPNLASPMTIHSRASELLEPMAPLKEITSFEQGLLQWHRIIDRGLYSLPCFIKAIYETLRIGHTF